MATTYAFSLNADSSHLTVTASDGNEYTVGLRAVGAVLDLDDILSILDTNKLVVQGDIMTAFSNLVGATAALRYTYLQTTFLL